MKTVYKYALNHESRKVQEITMPDLAFIHSVIIDNYGIHIYALVDTEQDKSTFKKFLVAYTGQSLNGLDFHFLGSGRVHEHGGIVYHVFQIL